MTIHAHPPANALAVHLDVEPFHVAVDPLWSPEVVGTTGVCFNPGCCLPFTRTRPWQWYCCDACRRQGDNEFRQVGHKIAPALLAWRLGKHPSIRTLHGVVPVTPEQVDLGRAARRYINQVQSAWYDERLRRAAGAQRS